MIHILIIIAILFIYISYIRCPREIYFDNNATTYPHPEVIKIMNDSWNLGNPSSYYASDAKNKIDELKHRILTILGRPNHRCIITSGASESINLLFRGYMNYAARIDDGAETIFTYKVPNINTPGRRIIISNVEHKTSIECVNSLNSLNYNSHSSSNLSNPSNSSLHNLHNSSSNSHNSNLIINISDILSGAVQLQRGDLLSVMAVNNETGDLFPIRQLGKIAHTAGAWFHTDMAQYFGKIESAANTDNVDCISISLHKLYGPIGIGALVVPKDFPIDAQISGSQNDGFRGGTENPALCAGALSAIEITLANRVEKNMRLKNMCNRFREMLSRRREVVDYKSYIGMNELAAYNKLTTGRPKIIFLSKNSINTVLVSFVNAEQGKRFCNIKFREELTKRNVKVSIGSACNTSTAGPSHVLLAMKLPFIIRCGVIRFSFGDYNTIADVDEFERRCGDLL